MFAVAFGSSYYIFFGAHLTQAFTAPIGKQIEISGIVSRISQIDSGQQVDVKLSEPYQGLIRMYAKPFPELKYGDVVKIVGALKAIEGPSSGYYAKEGIGAIMSFPKSLEITGHDQGSKVLARLYGIRDYVRTTFEKALPPEQATLMTGLLIGKSSGFSKEFNEKLKVTGTTHLVALSGYNVALIIEWLLAIFGLFLRRKYAVWFCVAAVIGFVIMTGAEASVVRAAIMATIVVLAERSERTYSVRNAVAFTALAMVLLNPRVIAFDIGFQLSFAALLGIVYVKPMLDQLFHRDPKKSGLLDWKENLVTTCAAQITVLPILLMNFGFITPIGIITNVLLLSFIPLTTLLGIWIIIASFLGSTIAFFMALPARILLTYELGVINLFSKIDFGFTTEEFSVVLAIIYYALLIGAMIFIKKKLETPAISV